MPVDDVANVGVELSPPLGNAIRESLAAQ
jgi:hypothetical protein